MEPFLMALGISFAGVMSFTVWVTTGMKFFRLLAAILVGLGLILLVILAASR